MPVFKLDLVFEAGGRGWTETYYRNFENADFASAFQVATTLATKRIELSARPVVIKAYRLQDPLTPGRQGSVFYFNPVHAAGPGPDDKGAASPDTAINSTWVNNASNASRTLQMRGVWDGAITNFNQLQDPIYATWKQKFDGFATYLRQQGFGWLSRPRAKSNVPVSYSIAVNALVPVFTFPPDTFTPEENNTFKLARFSKFNGSKSELNRELVIKVTGTATAEVAAPIAVGPMILGGPRDHLRHPVARCGQRHRRYACRPARSRCPPFVHTWTVAESAAHLVPFNPCGRGVDYLRTAATDHIKPFRDSDLVVERRWFRVPEGTPLLGFPSAFLSAHWEPYPYLPRNVGETYPPDVSYERRGILGGFNYEHVCGTEEDFQLGATFDPTVNQLYDSEWIPLCCGREEMCVTQLCGQAQVNDRPAAQLKSYAVPHQNADGDSPFQLFQVALNADDHTPAWPGFLFAWNPAGANGARDWYQAVVSDDLGVLQYVEEFSRFAADNTITQRQTVDGWELTVEQGGVSGTLTAAIVGGVLQIGGVNVEFDLGLGTAAYEDIGTSGATVPLLNGTNTFSAPQWFETGAGSSYSLHAHKTTTINNASLSPVEVQGTCTVDTVAGYTVALPIYGKTGSLDGVTFANTIATVVDATPATRKLRVRHVAGGNPDREYLRGEALAAGPGIGFLGATAVGPQAGDIGAALVAFGLMTGTPSFAGNSATATLASAATVLATPRNINGVAFDGSADITIWAADATTVGQLVCTAHAITAAAGTFQATGNTIALPAAGTYRITANVRGDLQQNAAGYHSVSVQLRNNTAGALIANTERIVTGANVNGSFVTATAALVWLITVGAATTVELYAMRTGTAWTISTIQSNADGRTVLEWERLY